MFQKELVWGLGGNDPSKTNDWALQIISPHNSVQFYI